MEGLQREGLEMERQERDRLERKVQITIKKDKTKKLGRMVAPVYNLYVCNTTNRLKNKK